MNQIVDVPQNTLTSTPSVISYSHADIKNMFDELHAAFQNAETWAKRVENIIDDVPIAAINQMRYAGYHISKVLSKSDFFPLSLPNQCLVNIDDLRSAYKHLLRAYFDSLDQLTQQIEAELKTYEANFQDLNLVVTDHFPQFFNWMDSVSKIGHFDISQNSTSVHQFAISQNDRQAHYKKIVEKIDDLENIKKQFRAIANCLVVQAKIITKDMQALETAEREAKEAKEREAETLKLAKSNAFWAKIAGVAALIAIIVAILIAVFQ